MSPSVLKDTLTSTQMDWHVQVLAIIPMAASESRLPSCTSAVAVIQSLPIFDETRLYSIPLPRALGQSLSFSYMLQIYLVLMFLGELQTGEASSGPSLKAPPLLRPQPCSLQTTSLVKCVFAHKPHRKVNLALLG